MAKLISLERRGLEKKVERKLLTTKSRALIGGWTWSGSGLFGGTFVKPSSTTAAAVATVSSRLE